MPRLKPVVAPVTIEIDGEAFPARDGEPVAASLLAADQFIFSRSPKYHRPRGPFCFTGACAQCLMRVDGVPNVPTCRVPAREGLRLERQNALIDARLDLLRANDFVFRDWFNHHEFLAGVPIAEVVLQKIARQLAGLGTLPERDAPKREPARYESHDIVIVGAGVAGLAASRALGDVEHVLLERNSATPTRPISGEGSTRYGAEVVGLFRDDTKPFLTVIKDEALTLISFNTLILANGGHPSLPTFPNNDLPGVISGRAVRQLIEQHGVLPGKRIACVGPEAAELVAIIQREGGEAFEVKAPVKRVRGLRRVTSIETENEKTSCDVIALCDPLTPAFELARAGGVEISWNSKWSCFVPTADENGQTNVPGIFVAGEVRGPVDAATAAEQGQRVAKILRPSPQPSPEIGRGGVHL